MPYTPTPQYTDFPHLRRSRRFKAAVEQALNLRTKIEALEEQLDEVKTQRIEPEMVEAEATRVVFNDYQIGIVDRKEGTKLDREKLIGVLEKMGLDSADIIKKASTPTAPSHYVEIRAPRDDKQTSARKVAKRMIGTGE